MEARLRPIDTSAKAPVQAFEPIAELRENPTMSGQVAAVLEGRIVRGELAAGTLLPNESELCELLGVSRSVVRDAVRTLAARGLVAARQGRGTIVLPADTAAYGEALTLLLQRSGLTMGDVVDARAVLEQQVCVLAAEHSTLEDHQAMAAHLEGLGDALEREDWARASNEHSRFHLALLHAVHLPAVELMLAPMQQVIGLSSTPPVPGTDLWDLDLHVPILDAVRAHNAAALAESLRMHYQPKSGRAYARWRKQLFRDATEPAPPKPVGR